MQNIMKKTVLLISLFLSNHLVCADVDQASSSQELLFECTDESVEEVQAELEAQDFYAPEELLAEDELVEELEPVDFYAPELPETGDIDLGEIDFDLSDLEELERTQPMQAPGVYDMMRLVLVGAKIKIKDLSADVVLHVQEHKAKYLVGTAIVLAGTIAAVALFYAGNRNKEEKKS
jgi:hypothetical protein